MRCLNCHHEEINRSLELCPKCGVYLPALMRDILPQGTQLRTNTYRLDYALGRGSFGITYCAYHNTLAHKVAIKEFFPQEYATRNSGTGELIIPINQQENYQKGLKRFLKEAQMLVKLHHGNVVKVQDWFEENNTAYIVMDLIEGTTLTLELHQQPEKKLPPQRVERLMNQLVSAITAIHEAGIYHLDLKPDNILITPEDNLVLVDFGAAKQVTSGSINRTRFFTESYAAPEVMIGGEVGPESDIFEMGMILYESLTGRLPTPALTRLLEGDHWTPTALEEPWRNLVLNALKIKREDRPSSARQWWQSRHKGQLDNLSDYINQKSITPVGMTLRGYFVLPSLKEQGMQQRFGRGVIREIFPIRDDLAVVIAAGGTTLFKLNSGDLLWEIDCPATTGHLSPNLTRLALVWQQDIYIWNLATGRLLQCLQGHLKPINSIAFSPDGNLLVSGSHDETLVLWDVNQGKVLHQLQDHNGYVTTVAFSPDGQLIASGSRDNTIRLWDVSSGQIVTVLQGHTEGIECVIFSPDGHYLASGSRDHTVKLWHLISKETVMEFIGHTDWIRSISFSEDNFLLASSAGIEDLTICVWDIPSGREILQLQGHWNTVKAIAFCPESRYLLSASYDYTLRLWDITEGEEIKQLNKHTNWVYCVACSPDGRLVASSGNDHLIRLWDSVQNREVSILDGHTNAISSLAFSRDGKYLVSGSWDQTVRVWEVYSGKTLRCLQGHQDFIKGVALSSDRRFIVSGSWDRTVRLWDLSSSWLPLGGGKGSRILNGHTDEVECVAFSLDNQLVASGSWDYTIRIWEVASGQELHKLEGHNWPVLSVAFSPDSRFLVSGSRDHSIRLWDVVSGQEIERLLDHTSFVNSVAFSPDGQFIASGSHDTTVRLWDFANGKVINVWQGHTSAVKSVAFSCDGTFVVSGDNDGVVRLWRV